MIVEKTEFQDKILICRDCSKEFIFTAGEQEFFVTKNFHAPARCKECRMKRKNVTRNSGINSQRESYEITCAGCGKKDSIPFKPVEGRQLFCRVCFKSMK
jgi:CxxC-x17-CxxC domain-containing protein